MVYHNCWTKLPTETKNTKNDHYLPVEQKCPRKQRMITFCQLNKNAQGNKECSLFASWTKMPKETKNDHYLPVEQKFPRKQTMITICQSTFIRVLGHFTWEQKELVLFKIETRGPWATMLTWVNSYKSLIQHFRLSVAMATNHNKKFVQLLYAWWRLLNKH